MLNEVTKKVLKHVGNLSQTPSFPFSLRYSPRLTLSQELLVADGERWSTGGCFIPSTQWCQPTVGSSRWMGRPDSRSGICTIMDVKKRECLSVSTNLGVYCTITLAFSSTDGYRVVDYCQILKQNHGFCWRMFGRCKWSHSSICCHVAGPCVAHAELWRPRAFCTALICWAVVVPQHAAGE